MVRHPAEQMAQFLKLTQCHKKKKKERKERKKKRNKAVPREGCFRLKEN